MRDAQTHRSYTAPDHDVPVAGPKCTRQSIAPQPHLTVVHQAMGTQRPRGLVVTADRNWCASLIPTGLVDITAKPDTALQWLSHRIYVAVFADKGSMGDTNGFRLAQIVAKRMGPNLPIFLLSETVTPCDQEYARRNSATSLLLRQPESLQQVFLEKVLHGDPNHLSKIDPDWRQRLKRCIQPIMGSGGAAAIDRALDECAALSSGALSPSDLLKAACGVCGERRDLRDRFVGLVNADYNQSKRCK